MAKAYKPTPAMRRVIENLLAGRPATYGFAGGRSTSGGLTGTFAALYQRGFIARCENGARDPVVTDAGRELVK